MIALTALPTAFALQSGQISPILLLGAVLFLECQKRGWQYCAAAATVLLAIKPHLAFLIWLAILFDAAVRGTWRAVLGGAATGLICTSIAFVFDRQILMHYADALGNRPPAEWVSPTIGTVLRMVLGWELFRFQFIPMLVGLVWFVWHCRRSQAESRSWNWCEQVPLLLLVSFVTAPYGAWPFDMVLLLPMAMWLILAPSTLGRVPGGRKKFIPIGLLAINVGCLVLNLLHVNSFWFLWVSPAVLVVYLVDRRLHACERNAKTERVASSDSGLVSA